MKPSAKRQKKLSITPGKKFSAAEMAAQEMADEMADAQQAELARQDFVDGEEAAAQHLVAQLSGGGSSSQGLTAMEAALTGSSAGGYIPSAHVGDSVPATGVHQQAPPLAASVGAVAPARSLLSRGPAECGRIFEFVFRTVSQSQFLFDSGP